MYYVSICIKSSVVPLMPILLVEGVWTAVRAMQIFAWITMLPADIDISKVNLLYLLLNWLYQKIDKIVVELGIPKRREWNVKGALMCFDLTPTAGEPNCRTILTNFNRYFILCFISAYILNTYRINKIFNLISKVKTSLSILIAHW